MNPTTLTDFELDRMIDELVDNMDNWHEVLVLEFAKEQYRDILTYMPVERVIDEYKEYLG
jgi:hypothetical protein